MNFKRSPLSRGGAADLIGRRNACRRSPLSRVNPFACFGLLFLIAFTLLPVHADTVTLVNGDHFSGKLLPHEGRKMSFKTEYAGVLKIDWLYVKKLTVDRPAVLQLDNGDAVRVMEIEINEGEIVYLPPEGGGILTVESEGVLGIHSEAWTMNDEGILSGQANLAFKSARGNGDEEFADLDFDLTYRRKDDRLRIAGELEYDTKIRISDREEVAKDKWHLGTSYDNFLSDKRYISNLFLVESNALSDLDSRYTVGPLYGYQFFESRSINLLTEIGILWVDENHHVAQNDAFWQPAWRIDYDQYIFEDTLQFYHEQSGSYTISGQDRWLLRSWTGFRIPIRSALQFSIEYKVEYDSEPVTEKDSTESTFRLKMGYKW